MSSDPLVPISAGCLEELATGPLQGVVTPYIEAFHARRYAKSTISHYLSCLAHFSHWLKLEEAVLSDIDTELVEHFIRSHLRGCTCPLWLRSTVSENRAALRHLLGYLPQRDRVSTPITGELDRFDDHLRSICGLAAQTRSRRRRTVGGLLSYCFGTTAPIVSRLSSAQVEAFTGKLSLRVRPATLGVICSDLRSYFRFRALQGDSTEALVVALPRIPTWRHPPLPTGLSEAQCELFLHAFDRSNPVELRDYAIARCLLDLGLRGDEVTHLSLESLDWHTGTLLVCSTKSKRAHRMPLPTSTGEAVADYLQQGRPSTTDRRLFVRHQAPMGKPLSVAAIRNSMNRAFTRCGLRDQFCNTHVLRRTAAARLQQAGASAKEIADVLRHRSLNTASTYVRIDVERLRAVALPWPGSSS